MWKWRLDPTSQRYYYIDQDGRYHFQDEQRTQQDPRNIPSGASASQGPGSDRPLYGNAQGSSSSYTYGTGAPASYNVNQRPPQGSIEPLTQDFGNMSVQPGTQTSQLTGTPKPSPQMPQTVQQTTWRDSNGIQFVDVHNPANDVRTIIQTGPANKITPAPLSKEGISSHMNLLSTDGEAERLFKGFRRREQPRKFFMVGKVFRVLWSEPAGESNTLVTALEPGTSVGRFGEPVYSKVRRFVVIRAGDNYCGALSIVTYGRRGVAKPGTNKSEHGIIYTGKNAPEPLVDEAPQRGERPMRPDAIRINTDNPTDKLDVMSRIDYGKVYTIQHNIKVQPYGEVHPRSLNALLHQFRNVWTDSEPATIESSEKASAGPSGRRKDSGVTSQRDARQGGRQSASSVKSGPSAGSQGRATSGGEAQGGLQSREEVLINQFRAAVSRLVGQGYTPEQAVEIAKNQRRNTEEVEEDSSESESDDDEDEVPQSATRGAPTNVRQTQQERSSGSFQQAGRAPDNPQQSRNYLQSQAQNQYQSQPPQVPNASQSQSQVQLKEAVVARLTQRRYSRAQAEQYISTNVARLVEQNYTQDQALQAILTQLAGSQRS